MAALSCKDPNNITNINIIVIIIIIAIIIFIINTITSPHIIFSLTNVDFIGFQLQ